MRANGICPDPYNMKRARDDCRFVYLEAKEGDSDEENENEDEEENEKDDDDDDDDDMDYGTSKSIVLFLTATNY
jgi:hypothetical protein